MASESHYFEGNYDEAFTSFKELLSHKEVSLFPREKSMALFFAGLTCERMHA